MHRIVRIEATQQPTQNATQTATRADFFEPLTGAQPLKHPLKTPLAVISVPTRAANRHTTQMTTRIERDKLLAATDLTALATEFCGAPTGHGRGARWHCPNPNHPDHHPSMTIYEGHRNQRWHCHSCGAGGTAIDLYANATGHPIGETIRSLAQRAGNGTGGGPPTPSATRLLPPKRAEMPVEEPRTPDPAIEMYVAAAQRLLWSPSGQGALEYLRGRGLSDRELLTLNRVGYDPGPRELPRAKGLPHQGSGIVLPVLNDDCRAIFCTVRYFDETKAKRRYDNPTTELAPNPKLARITPVADEHPEVVIITEGIFDALTAARHGYNAIAVLGIANVGEIIAEQIPQLCRGRRIVVAFDGDEAGRNGARRLASLLLPLDRATTITRSICSDLNDHNPKDLAAVLLSSGRVTQSPTRPSPPTAPLLQPTGSPSIRREPSRL